MLIIVFSMSASTIQQTGQDSKPNVKIFSTRVPVSLITRAKFAALESGKSVQQLFIEALVSHLDREDKAKARRAAR